MLDGINTKELQVRLYERAKAVGDMALKAGGGVSAEAEESLDRLARVVRICESLEQRERKRWPVIATLIATGLLLSGLFFGRLGTTEIELDAKLSEISFSSPVEQVITKPVQLSVLGLSGLTRVEWTRVPDRNAKDFLDSGRMGPAMEISPATGNDTDGMVTLGELAISKGSRLYLRGGELSQKYRLSIEDLQSVIRAGVHHSIDVSIVNKGQKQIAFPTPRSIFLHPDPRGVDIDVTFPVGKQSAFLTQLSAEDIRLFRVDRYSIGGQTSLRHVSTVVNGTIYFEELNGRERHLRPGDGIRFESCQGIIRGLQLSDGYIDLEFHGRVQGMSTGSGNIRTDIMPTYLEWLQARHGLALLWGAAVYIFSLAFGILRWWGLRV